MRVNRMQRKTFNREKTPENFSVPVKSAIFAS